MSTQYTANRPVCVYLIRMGDTNYFKVGISNNLASRMDALQTAAPVDLILIRAVEQEDAAVVERNIHAALQEYRARNEWFLCDLATISRIFDDYNTMAIVDSHLDSLRPTRRLKLRLPAKKLVTRYTYNGVEYLSIQTAADAHGISRQAMSKRLKKDV